MFSKHHYLSHSFNKAARVFILRVDGITCGFSSVLPRMGRSAMRTYQEHRTVILPDYQGIGFGHRLSSSVGDILKKQKIAFISTTSAPSLIHARKNDPNWITTRIGSVKRGKEKNKGMSKTRSVNRITASFRYKKVK